MTVRTTGAFWAPPRMRPSLGQAAVQARIVVTDANGRPVSADVSVNDGASGRTDADGSFSANVPSGRSFKVSVKKDNHVVVKEFPAPGPGGETAYVQIPVCFGQPFLTTVEAVALGTGAVLTVVGIFSKFKPAEIGGEIFVAGSVGTFLFRHSCL